MGLMTLKLINKSSYPTSKILKITPFKYIETDVKIITDSQGTFGMDSQALYVTDDKDNIKGYAGATYIKGAITVYDVKDTLNRLGEVGGFVISLRIKHEILHHFALPADDMDTWLENKPILKFIYSLTSPERFIGACIQAIYYNQLLKGFDIDKFDVEEDIENRNYQGVLTPK